MSTKEEKSPLERFGADKAGVETGKDPLGLQNGGLIITGAKKAGASEQPQQEPIDRE